jgi:hypothetical protein
MELVRHAAPGAPPDLEAVGAAMLAVDDAGRIVSDAGWQNLIGSPAPDRLPEGGSGEDGLLEMVGAALEEAKGIDGSVNRVAHIDLDRRRYYFIAAGPIAGAGNGRKGCASSYSPVLVTEITGAFKAGPKEGEEIRQLAHDLRSPMTSMSGAVELLQSGRIGQVTPEQGRLLSMLRKGIDMMLVLIDRATEEYRRSAGILLGIEPTEEP